MTRLTLYLTTAALLAMPLFPGVAPASEVVVRDYAGELPDTESGLAVILVVDARTGLPVEGATVQRCPEWELGPRGWAPVRESAKTDRFGLACLAVPEDPGPAHFAIRAPGYGGTEEYGERPQERVELLPGRALHGRVLDALGQPAANVLVEHKLGCAHAPALQQARTDSTGYFALADVGEMGDLVIGGPGVAEDYHVQEPRPTWAEPTPFHTDVGHRFEAHIVPGDWKLIEPYVHAVTSGRGPCGTVGSDGRFVLEGTARGTTIRLMGVRAPPGTPPDQGYLVETQADLYRPGAPAKWRLGTDIENEDTEAVIVHIAPEHAEGEVEIHFDRIADGARLSRRVHLPPDEPLEVGVPLGSYHVHVGDPFSRWRAGPVPFDHRAEGTILRLDVKTQAHVRIAMNIPPSGQGVRVDLMAQGESMQTTLEDLHEAAVPPDGRVHVRVTRDGQVVRGDLAPARKGVRVLRGSWPRTKAILFKGWHPEGEVDVTIPGDPWTTTLRTDAGLVVKDIRSTGRVPVRIEAPGVRTWLPIDLPPNPRVIRVAPPRRSVGRAYFGARPTDEPPFTEIGLVSTPIATRTSGVVVWERDRLAWEPWATHPLFRSGAWIRLHAFGDSVPHRIQLRGAGPYMIVRPTGAVQLDVDPAGEAKTLVVLIDGHVREHDVVDGPVRLSGVRTGRHEILIGAEGHRPQQVTLSVQPGSTTRVKVPLPRRD